MKHSLTGVLITAVSICLPALALADEKTSDVDKLQVSLKTWANIKAESGGNYRYFVRTSSFSGLRTETEIVVRNNKVVERNYSETLGRPPIPGEKPTAGKTWSESGSELGQHKQGAPVKTLDQLYKDARKVLDHKLSPSERRYVRFDKQGLLNSCFYVDTRIADDAPTTGVMIAEIRVARK